MYPKPKKSAGTWFANIFVTLCVLIFVAVLAVGIFIARDGGEGFRNLVSGNDGNPLGLSK